MYPRYRENKAEDDKKPDIRRNNSPNAAQIEGLPIGSVDAASFFQTQEYAGDQVPANDKEQVHSHPKQRNAEGMRAEDHQYGYGTKSI